MSDESAVELEALRRRVAMLEAQVIELEGVFEAIPRSIKEYLAEVFTEIAMRLNRANGIIDKMSILVAQTVEIQQELRQMAPEQFAQRLAIKHSADLLAQFEQLKAERPDLTLQDFAKLVGANVQTLRTARYRAAKRDAMNNRRSGPSRRKKRRT